MSLQLKKRKLVAVSTCTECPKCVTSNQSAIVTYSCLEIGALFEVVKRNRHASLVRIDADLKGIHKDCPLESVVCAY